MLEKRRQGRSQRVRGSKRNLARLEGEDGVVVGGTRRAGEGGRG